MATHDREVTRETSKPEVQLSGTPGNVFSIIGLISRTLKKAKQPEKAAEFTAAAMNAESYEAVLQLAMQYCDVS